MAVQQLAFAGKFPVGLLRQKAGRDHQKTIDAVQVYINAQYIAAGRIASVDGKNYFDLNTGNAVLRGSFSTLERDNSTGTYRVYFDSGSIACQKKNGDGWDSPGFLAWNYGVSPPETWLKVSRIDALNSLDSPGYS